MTQRVGHRLLNDADHRVGGDGQAVVDPQSVAPRFDEALPPQIRQMPRGFRLRDAEAFVDVADADFPGQQEAEDPQTRGVGKGAEQLFHVLDLLVHISALTNIPRRS